MNGKLSRFLSWAMTVLILIGAGTFGTTNVMAGDRYRKDLRRHDGQVVRAAAVDRDLRQHERERRAFVAGAAVQQHRNDNRNYYRGDYRDGYRDRYRDRYYEDNDDHDNKIGAALVGAAVGAVVTGVVMSNRNNESSSNASSDSKK
ncbi:MAG TPA: hypothetical protein PK752_12175 [Accumulibacter sp.]|uniref:hypothetical protein n=1 Tax=Accumulibacter sp. TaxID=2053492 RepID=UPI002D1DD052|nr:hypothetical protein [Accumulibacter sp.]HRD88992.1 hypothetical protein [Accumulibacter sp.]